MFPFYVLFTTGYLVDTSDYLAVTSSYLIATIVTSGYFLLLVCCFSNTLKSLKKLIFKSL